MKEKSEIIYEKNEIINDLREQLIKVESLSVTRIEQLEIELAKEKNNTVAKPARHLVMQMQI